jgi:hypothetical protein
MIALAIISLIVGAALGLRFKVLILLPAILAGLLGAAMSSILIGSGDWLPAMILTTIGLQLGYVGASATLIVIKPAHRPRPAAQAKTITGPIF